MRRANPVRWIVASYVCTAAGVIVAVVPLGGCDAGDPVPIGAVVGESVEGIGYCISNVRVDPNTIHFVGQQWLIGAAEGHGPRDVYLEISTAVAPTYSTTTTFTVDSTDVSEAVGYSLTTTYSILAGSTIAVPEDAFQRLEGYTAYQRALWQIQDGACAGLLGYGASYKPIGVYFQTVDAGDRALLGPGVIVDDCSIPGCPPPPVVVVQQQVADAGEEDAADAEVADAGPPTIVVNAGTIVINAGSVVINNAGTPEAGVDAEVPDAAAEDAGAPVADGG